MRRERKENETAMQHYVKWYECASLNTFWPATEQLCRRANAVVRCCVPAEVDASSSNARAVSPVAIARRRTSKDNFEAKWRRDLHTGFFKQRSAALANFTDNTEAVVPVAFGCEALDYCEPAAPTLTRFRYV